jgi:hypothetical protein
MKAPIITLAVTLFALTAMSQSTPRDLQLVANVVPSANAAQSEVVVTFLNDSGHTLSFPKPFLFCRELAGIGCAACRVRMSDPDILEQTKDWIVLAPGESVDVKDRLAKGMIIGDAGTYELRVIYSGPVFDRRDLTKLREAGIIVPSTGKYGSDPITFEVQISESNTY